MASKKGAGKKNDHSFRSLPTKSDRSFILLGKASSGKSTLGNLLLGKRPFKEHEFHEAHAMTKNVRSAESQIEASHIYQTEGGADEMLTIQVLDQPGFNDINFKQENLCEFLKKCIAESKAEMSASFLILIDLSGSYFSAEELLTILNLAEILSESSYSFFSNASIVFTHLDVSLVKYEGQDPQQILEQLLQEEAFENVQELIYLVGQRYIFINGRDRSEVNRFNILKNLFDSTRPNLSVYINGNNGFKGNELKRLFRESEHINTFKRNLPKYDVEYHFNPDLNLFRKFEKKNLDQQIADALEKLSGISTGISAVVLLVSLVEVFNKEINKLILNLPKTYNLGSEFKNDFWNYACIVFKAPTDDADFVKKNIKGNELLKGLDTKVKSRYTWVTNITPPEECSRRLTDLVRMVKLDAEGKTYTDSVVLGEMGQKIRGARRLRRGGTLRRMDKDITDEDLREEIPFFKSYDGSKVRVACNNFFWDNDTITPRIGYFVLKNINPDAAEQFKVDYPDLEIKIPTKDYSRYCLKALEKN